MLEEIMDEQERVVLFLETMLDKSQSIENRDSAAIYLGHCDSDEGLKSLIECACNDHEDSTLLQACGSAIAEIWDRNKNFDIDVVLGQVSPPAKEKIHGWLNSK